VEAMKVLIDAKANPNAENWVPRGVRAAACRPA